MIEIDLGLDCESPETVSRRQLCQELQAAKQRAAVAETVLKREQERYHWLLDLSKRLSFVNVELQDINDGLKAENARLQELVKTFMAADLARADLDRD